MSLCPEEIQRRNVFKTEILLENSHGELSKGLQKSFEKIKENLEKYEVGNTLLNRISDDMHTAAYMETLDEAEEIISHLANTFWN